VRPWRVEASELIVDRTWLRIHEQRIALPSGGHIDEFHLIEGPSWAAALALTDDDRVVVVEQYRHGLGGPSVELPAGVLEAGEDPFEGARRELREETGYEADDWRPLLAVSTEPARHTTRAHFYFARGARRAGDQRLDPSEEIATRAVPAAELVRLALEGGVVHGVHVAAILAASSRGWLGDGGPGRRLT
jgi:8-oxo-dGTP pyrophosphatase MutT (NUDIX family)